jgi:hypothetical protein
MKVGVGREGCTADLRRCGGLEGSETLLEACLAILRRRLKPEDGCECTAMNYTLAGVASGLEAQRVDIRSPGECHACAREPA